MSSTEPFHYTLDENEILPGDYLVSEVGILATCV
jgi:hypothetical protein